jgi:hypothetical protein
MYLNDSTGQIDPQRYNLAIWNGTVWKLQRLLYQGYSPVIKSVFAINDHDVWLDPWFHWNGQSFQEFSVDPIFMGIGINKMWGNSNDVFVVGDNGFIAHYNGVSWAKIESGTTTPVDDIFGQADGQQNSTTVIAAVSDENQVGDYRILSLHPTGVTDTLNWNLGRRVVSVWFKGATVYECGSGVRKYNKGSWNDINLPNIFTHKIRGNDVNDIFVCGALGLLAHYNGSTWQVYEQFQSSDADFISLSVRDNIIVAGGFYGDNALIVLGKRN